jgi:hypothetical protein
METREYLAEYLDAQAAWRGLKAEKYPDDARNERSAAGLRELAAQVRALADDDPVLLELEKLCEAAGLDVSEVMPSVPGIGVNASQSASMTHASQAGSSYSASSREHRMRSFR